MGPDRQMEDLNDLAVFVKVVENAGFTAAAPALRMSAALVSRRLSHLEADMGVQLINRSTRHLVLTEAGEEFYKECVRVLAMIDAARASATGLSREPKGTLRVHAAVGVGQGLVTEAVTVFKQQYPDIGVDLHISSTRANYFQRGYDIVIKTAELEESGLQCREFGQIRHIVVASEQYLARAGVPKAPHDLADFECLLLYGRRPPNEWRFTSANSVYTVKVNGSFKSSSALAVYTAAVNDLGIARLPEYVLYGRSDAGKLRIIFDDCLPPERSLKAYYPRSRYVPAKVHAFMESVEQASQNSKSRLRDLQRAQGVANISPSLADPKS